MSCGLPSGTEPTGDVGQRVGRPIDVLDERELRRGDPYTVAVVDAATTNRENAVLFQQIPDDGLIVTLRGPARDTKRGDRCVHRGVLRCQDLDIVDVPDPVDPVVAQTTKPGLLDRCPELRVTVQSGIHGEKCGCVRCAGVHPRADIVGGIDLVAECEIDITQAFPTYVEKTGAERRIDPLAQGEADEIRPPDRES